MEPVVSEGGILVQGSALSLNQFDNRGGQPSQVDGNPIPAPFTLTDGYVFISGAARVIDN